MYHIKKGKIDASKTITMSDLLNSGCLCQIKYGVKLLSKGIDKLKDLGTPIHLEISDASKSAIDAVKATGGSITVKYRTPLLMRFHLKPHKFSSHKDLKTPMPPQKRLQKLENLIEKGLQVEYPRTPWFTDNKEAILAEAKETERRIKEG